MRRKSLSVIDKTAERFASDPQKQIRELKRLVRLGKQAGDVRFVGAAYSQIAEAYHELGDIEGIFENALKAEALLRELKGTPDFKQIVYTLNQLGYVYAFQENSQMALAYYEEVDRIVKKYRMKGRLKTSVMNNVANCYHALGDYKTSIRILTECMKLMPTERPGDHAAFVMYSLNLAESCHHNGESQRGREVLDSVEPLLEHVTFKPLCCDFYLRYALICDQLGEKEESDACVDKAFALIPEKPIPDPVYDDLRDVMHVLTKNKDQARAKKIVELMNDYYESRTGAMERLIAVRAIAEYYACFGQYKRAASYMREMEELTVKRNRELKQMQLNVHNRMKATEEEIAKLQKKMRRNEERYSREPMTGLLNRAALLEVASTFIPIAARKKEKIGAIFLDIDYFKECNDTYGHAKGDEIIKLVARACRREENANVRFARYGGDEFFGITRGLDDEAVTAIARRICAEVREADIPNEKNPHGQRITLSAGLVNVAVNGQTDTIIGIANFADKAVYYAKNAGKNAIYRLDYSGGGAVFVRIEE